MALILLSGYPFFREFNLVQSLPREAKVLDHEIKGQQPHAVCVFLVDGRYLVECGRNCFLNFVSWAANMQLKDKMLSIGRGRGEEGGRSMKPLPPYRRKSGENTDWTDLGVHPLLLFGQVHKAIS